MRGALITAVVGLASTLAVLVIGWGVQRVALPSPKRADRVAADTAAWLLRYRMVSSWIDVGGSRQHGLCLQGWFPRRDGVLGHGETLLLGATRIVSVGGPLRVEGPSATTSPARAQLELELAGCPNVVGADVARAAQNGAPLRVERAYAADTPALALRLPQPRDERLTLYVSARTYRPLKIDASFRGLSGSALVNLTRATRPLLARFASGPGGRPEWQP